MAPPDLEIARLAASEWNPNDVVLPVGTPGLINGTWCVGDPVSAILQWVNPIFAPEVQLDIDQVTRRLIDQGVSSPTLVRTRSGALWVPDVEVGGGPGTWRMLTFVEGTSMDRLESAEQAFEAAQLVGRFHAALDGWNAPRHAPVRRIHDTPARMADLRAALAAHPSHHLATEVGSVAAQILSDWEGLHPVVGLTERICHGDLKISNVRFDESGRRALCLIDLDTVGPMELACELGDMWRSWCNPAGEDDPDHVVFDLSIFQASAEGFFATAPSLADDERRALATATVRICLELSARFAADALNNSYFREDSSRFDVVGAHNLHRARAQLQLARRARAMIPDCAKILGLGSTAVAIS